MWITRFTLASGTFALLVLLNVFSAARSQAAESYDFCGDEGHTTASLMDVYMTDALSVLESHGASISPDDLKKSVAEFKSRAHHVSRYCKSSDPKTLFALTLLDAWGAWLQHWNGTDTDGIAVEAAVQHLTECSVHYFGTDEGATCAQWEKRMIAWQTKWESETTQ